MNEYETESPCTGQCACHSGVCSGCGRTMTEIATWNSLSDREKDKINKRIHNEKE